MEAATTRCLCLMLTATSMLVLARNVAAQRQAAELKAMHRAGQTFLTWREVGPPPADNTIAAIRKSRQLGQPSYRIYRSNEPIHTVESMQPIAEAPSLTGWNADYHGIYPKPTDRARRYVIVDGGDPVPPQTGIYVHHPQQAGRAYYAVTTVVDGEEVTQLDSGNTLTEPVDETVGQGVPVLQRIERPERFNYVDGSTLCYFVRWEAPPRCAVESKPFDYLVAVPPNLAEPAPVGIHLHCWGGNLDGGYGWWYQAEQGHLLIASNQLPYDWWTGYHEQYWNGDVSDQRWRQGVVRPYTQRRLLAFLDWVATRWDVDLTRTHVAGNSMGGSGAPMLAIRHPDRIAWATGWVGVHNPLRSPQFRGSYERVFGDPDWGVTFEDGTPVWDYFNDVWYLRQHPEKEVGLICFSNGKNDSGIGWPQAVEFFEALQQTRRPHVFVWGQSGHGQRARLPISLDDRRMPIDLRVDQSQPAFTKCSLDENPGKGAPNDGDAAGQANLYLFWQTDDVVDRPDRWEMTVGLVEQAPHPSCIVDVTPRRRQQFMPPVSTRLAWRNVDPDDAEPIQQGTVTVDRHGLFTLPKVRVGRNVSRLVVTPAD